MPLAAQPETLVQLALIIPLLAALLIPLFHRMPNLREAVTLIASVALATVVWSLYGPVLAGARPELIGPEIVPGLSMSLKVEPLGMIYALVASSLWIVNSIYSIGYMRGNNEPRQTTFYIWFAIAIASAISIAFSKNLITLFLSYEILTLSTYPLVTHKATDEARKSGRKYLLLLIGTSMALLLPAIIITAAIAGTADFTAGGILAGKLTPILLSGLLALYVFGIGKAAVMPVHFWLPAAMVAPTPVSALLHAVAVVKAGVFTVLKVVVYIFGIETLTQTGASWWLIWVASFTIIVSSLIALRQDNLKKRLAYSTVSQLSYIVLGACLATAASITGGALHIVMHAVGKITLFFCAGAIYVAHHKTEISELDGIGRLMPVTMGAFLIGALSIIGLPPFGGTWSKLYLALGALDAGYMAAVAVFMISSLLNIAYLTPIAARAFFKPLPGVAKDQPVERDEAPLPILIAISISAAACIVLFFFAQPIIDFISLIEFDPPATDGNLPQAPLANGAASNGP
jgi:multicomponent Na+:H+ antiporter subunit D